MQEKTQTHKNTSSFGSHRWIYQNRNIQEPGKFPVQAFADCALDSIIIIYLSAIKCSSLNITSLELKVHWGFARIFLISFVSSPFSAVSHSNQFLSCCFLVQWVGQILSPRTKSTRISQYIIYTLHTNEVLNAKKRGKNMFSTQWIQHPFPHPTQTNNILWFLTGTGLRHSAKGI